MQWPGPRHPCHPLCQPVNLHCKEALAQCLPQEGWMFCRTALGCGAIPWAGNSRTALLAQSSSPTPASAGTLQAWPPCCHPPLRKLCHLVLVAQALQLDKLPSPQSLPSPGVSLPGLHWPIYAGS